MSGIYELILKDGTTIQAFTTNLEKILEIYMKAGNDDTYIWIISENTTVDKVSCIKNSLVSYIRLPSKMDYRPI